MEVHFSNNRIFSARNAKLFPGQLSVGEDFGKERPMATMWIIDLVREQALFLAYRIRAMDGREHSSARLAAGGKHSTISAEVRRCRTEAKQATAGPSPHVAELEPLSRVCRCIDFLCPDKVPLL